MCPIGYYVGINAGSPTWSLCTGEPGAGNQGKAVYRDEVGRGWVRVAYTEILGRSHGGIKLRLSGRNRGRGERRLWNYLGVAWNPLCDAKRRSSLGRVAEGV
jgi:hypothetical protein